MSKYIDLNNENFEEITKNGVVLVDFWAPWCGPCRMLGPTIEQLAIEYEGKAKICKINTEENQDLAEKFQVRGIPFVMYMKDGVIVESKVGVESKNQMVERIEKLL